MTQRTEMKAANTSATKQKTDFHGAALIDAQGREIPITEDMVQQACEHLEHAWQYPINHAQSARRVG